MVFDVDAIVERARNRYRSQDGHEPPPAAEPAPDLGAALLSFVFVLGTILAAYALVNGLYAALAWVVSRNVVLGAAAAFSVPVLGFFAYLLFQTPRAFALLELVFSISAGGYFGLRLAQTATTIDGVGHLLEVGGAVSMFVHALFTLRDGK